MSKEAGERASGMLTSWKEIADHLGVTVRTAQSYEKSRALPVRRMGARVAILESELRAWQLSNLVRPAWWARTRILQWWALCATSLLLAAALGGAWYYWTQLSAGQPIYASWQGSLLVAVDARGHTAWQRQYLSPLIKSFPSRTVDLNHDGRNETVMCFSHSKRESNGWEVQCLSSKGEDRWRLAVTRTVSNAAKQFAPPYVVREFTVFPSPEKDGTWWTAAVFAHHVEYPSVLLVADGQGRLRGEFWHAGQLNSVKTLDLDGDGIVEILAAGVQHGAERAVLQVLDPRDVHGAAHIEPPDSPVQLVGMAPGTERTTVYFPRTELSRKTEKFNWAAEIELPGDAIQVTVYEHAMAPHGYLVWTLTRDLEVKDLLASVALENVASQALRKGEVLSLQSQAEQEKLKRQLRVVRRSR